MTVKKDLDAASGDGKGEDSEYVRIDTKSSRARQGHGGYSPGPSYEGRSRKIWMMRITIGVAVPCLPSFFFFWTFVFFCISQPCL